MGQILHINLTNRKAKILELKPDLLRKFLGASGLGAKLLYDNVKPETDPYSPDNWMIFMTGPVAGTLVPTGSRYAVVTKSPLTGSMAEAWAGGHYGHKIKLSGYDGFIVVGRSQKPVYLWIDNGNIEFRDANHLWGKTTHETEGLIKAEVGNYEAGVACIGPAGENLVRIASIMNDEHNALGRCGVGAVMGSKNLKAIAVHGYHEVPVANMDELLKIVFEAYDRIKKNAPAGNVFPQWGTLSTVNSANEAGILPTRNFRFGTFEEVEKIRPETIRGNYIFKDASCYTCPVACKKRTKVRDKHTEIISGGPEYETLWAFSAHCGNSDMKSIIKANNLCNLYGLDTISTGGVIGFAMECYEKQLLTKKELDGQDLSFGNSDAIVESVHRIAYRKGYGNLLAEGVKRVAEKLNATDFAMHVKGLEMPGYDPRGAVGMGLAYATSNRGCCHNRAWVVGVEMYTDIDRFTTKGKAKLCKDIQDYTAVKDSLSMCIFVFSPNDPAIDIEWLIRMLKALTGFAVTEKELWTIGERIWNLVRAFNVRAGIRRKDDTLPKRLLEETLPYGPSKGRVVKLEKMLDEYYRLRKWNKKGIPTQEKLLELDLADVAEDLGALEKQEKVCQDE